MTRVIFLHGLNTYGDDLLHVGPVTRGLMHERMASGLERRGVSFTPVLALGAGPPESQAIRALAFCKSFGLLDGRERFHLLGHSTGGLVARVLAASPELNSRIQSIITVGTPHLGSVAARFGLEFAERNPFLHRAFATFGYDTLKKHEIFRHFTPEAMVEFNRRFPPLESARELTLLCEAKESDLSWPLKLLQRRMRSGRDSENRSEAGDGFIPSASQRRGTVLGPFNLDHFGELGFFFQSSSRARRRAQLEFDRMLDAIVLECRPQFS